MQVKGYEDMSLAKLEERLKQLYIMRATDGDSWIMDEVIAIQQEIRKRPRRKPITSVATNYKV